MKKNWLIFERTGTFEKPTRMTDTKCTNMYVHSPYKRKNILRFILDPSATYYNKIFGTFKVLVFSLCVCVCVATSFWPVRSSDETSTVTQREVPNCCRIFIAKCYLPFPGFPMIFHLSLFFFLLFLNHKNSVAPIKKGNKP